ncbi:MAG: asparagine synthase (glutamine-hydrolyzing) [Planctomycetota bacterium]|nr:MAG: asparagine synthase (glutamine-hydrolyzing) [Planctomycetota bacterium]
MCGIIGILNKTPLQDRSWLSKGRDTMTHRGPDSSGEWWSKDGRVGLGHRRLSIIDLSPSGHQPMQDAKNELCIVFNGEIYNYIEIRNKLISKGHQFKSKSDTEVILEGYLEWGIDCISKFNGMFAFALFDSRNKTLLIARDRAGEKPLFYSLENNSLCFSSELKGLMSNPNFNRYLDHEAFDCYLSMGFVPGELCLLKGVKKLPPAHALIYDLNNGQSKVWCYWELPELDESVNINQNVESDLLEELEQLLEDSVKRQLVADVPVGILLSGGVDSSLITAMATRATPNVKTFTVCFPNYGKFDESEHARLIAKHFKTEHIELQASEISVDLLPMLAKQFDEPMVDSSMIPMHLVSQLVRKHCKVALGGDGGDELFGGYGHYSRLLWLQKKLGWMPEGFRKIIAKSSSFLLPIGFKGRNWLQSLNTDFKSELPLIANYFDNKTRKRLMCDQSNWKLVAEDIRNGSIPKNEDLLQRSTRVDFENYLVNDILVKVDRASMLNSLEIRAPFLDYRLIEFAFKKVPSHLKSTIDQRKILLKKLTSKILPANFDQSRKQGFSIPLASWLQSGPWKKYFQEILLDSNNSFFNRNEVSKLLEGQSKGRSNSERLFSLVLFELWQKEYNVSW